MSLDIYLKKMQMVNVHQQNITHNLGHMAKMAGLYAPLWRPEENNITHANQLIPYLETGIALMKEDPARYEQYNPENGWGSYAAFLPWLEKLLTACKEHPDAEIESCR